MLTTLSRSLIKATDSGRINEPLDSDVDRDSGCEASDDEDWVLDDVEHSDFRRTAALVDSEETGGASATLRHRIRKDLKIAKAAGFKIGHHGLLLEGHTCHVSLACRVSKLGISCEAMQAWQLKPAMYLILLIFYPSRYRTVEDCGAHGARQDVQFRIGLSNEYKPSREEATRAFSAIAKSRQLDGTDEALHGSETGYHESFISKPLHCLYEHFTRFVRYRLTSGKGWDEAEAFYAESLGQHSVSADPNARKQHGLDHPASCLPEIVMADHLRDRGGSIESLSLPLISMQFLLRHFVRCTEFCLNCFRTLGAEQGALLKPYVCGDPLW